MFCSAALQLVMAENSLVFHPSTSLRVSSNTTLLQVPLTITRGQIILLSILDIILWDYILMKEKLKKLKQKIATKLLIWRCIFLWHTVLKEQLNVPPSPLQDILRDKPVQTALGHTGHACRGSAWQFEVYYSLYCSLGRFSLKCIG